MGIFEFKLPDIGEGVVEGEVVEWMVAVGDTVKEDDPILSVMTDKATVEIPAPCDGTVKSLVGEAGDILPVGAVCIVFDVDGAGNANSDASAPEPAETLDPVAAPEPAAKPEPSTPASAPVAPSTPAPANPVARAPGTKVLASPAVRQRARSANISLELVAGSGPAGRVSHADLDRHIAGGGASTAPASGGRANVMRNGTEDIKIIGLRRKIADGMMASYSSIPHFSYFEEVDVTELESLRQHLNAPVQKGLQSSRTCRSSCRRWSRHWLNVLNATPFTTTKQTLSPDTRPSTSASPLRPTEACTSLSSSMLRLRTFGNQPQRWVV